MTIWNVIPPQARDSATSATDHCCGTWSWRPCHECCCCHDHKSWATVQKWTFLQDPLCNWWGLSALLWLVQHPPSFQGGVITSCRHQELCPPTWSNQTKIKGKPQQGKADRPLWRADAADPLANLLLDFHYCIFAEEKDTVFTAIMCSFSRHTLCPTKRNAQDETDISGKLLCLLREKEEGYFSNQNCFYN